MSATYAIDQDLREAAAMAKALEDYVRGDELYGSAGGGFFSKLPSLTVGALVLRLRRLAVLAPRLNDAQAAQLRAAQTEHERVRREWTMHYEHKALREGHSRLDAMRPYFQEATQDRSLARANYIPEAQRRTIVQELFPALEALRSDGLAELRQKASASDGRLRGFAKPDGFWWAEILQPAYPQPEFWWLYARPPVEDGD